MAAEAFINDGHVESEIPAGRKRRLYESRREREFYSYYESVLSYASSEPKFCDLKDPKALESHMAIPSADKTLTAFTQLAALRLNSRRAMIFFFDSEYAYIMAESTRSMSLHDDSHHASGDSLWLGFTKIPRGFSVCEVTADLPANPSDNAQNSQSSSIVHIINNLSEDTRFCDRPYVQDGPKARFYAGVPITTPKGINIGALCVLDDKPRDGLDDEQVDFLRGMATTIMSHLILVKEKEDNQRSHDMNTALGAFMEGKSDLRDWWHRNAHSTTSHHSLARSNESRLKTYNDRVPVSPISPDTNNQNSEQAGYFASNHSYERPTSSHAARSERVASSHGSSSNAPSPAEFALSTRPTLKKRNSSGTSAPSIRSNTGPRPKATGRDHDLGSRIKATATRAARLIQEGVSADGVLFLDAAVNSYGGLIDRTQDLPQGNSESDTSHASDAGNSDRSRISEESRPARRVSFSEPSKHSALLGSAYSTDIEPRVRDAIQHAKISEKVLRSLLRRYPDGQVWHFNEDGDASDDDDDDHAPGHDLASTSSGDSAESEVEHQGPSLPSKRRAAKRKRTRLSDGRVIQGIFPGIRSVLFLGMWDPHQERWFGASVILSYSSTRIFSIRNELSYLAAFCDVVLGEIWRLEAQEVGRSKNDFISSISHELRSPLHGILGSAECLEEQEQSLLNQELIRSILSCGTTLLDIVNDLLEYSRLNHITQNWRDSELFDNAKPSSAATLAAVREEETGVMISTLIEDAVEAACLGFDDQSTKQQGSSSVYSEQSAMLTLDIDDARNPEWHFCVPSGSWKRICLNVVLNALKYTPTGYIVVTLKKKLVKKKGSRERSALVELVVEDSGIGMSGDFQEKSLFRPFQQENSLTPGTGLGMNLVAQIVKNLGGTIKLRSSKGVGTTVKVSLPLRCAPPASPSNTSFRSLEFTPSKSSVGFLGFGVLGTDLTRDKVRYEASKRLLSSLKRTCEQLGMGIAAFDDALENNASIYIAREQEHTPGQFSMTSDSNLRRSLLATRRPLIFICASRESALRLRSKMTTLSLAIRTQYLWPPVGPAKLIGAISACLKSGADSPIGPVSPGAMRASPSPLDYVSMKSNRLSLRSSIPRPTTVPNPSEESTKETIETTSEPDAALKETQDGLRPIGLQRSKRSESEAMATSGSTTLQLRSQLNRTSTAPYSGSGTLSLLLVDDNSVNLRLLEVFAKRAGHIYSIAQNGQEAVEYYKRIAKAHRGAGDDALGSDRDLILPLPTKPEVILMDINMPVMDGFEATRAIRRFEQAEGEPRAIIIAVTGLGDTAAQEQAFASGMDLFLTKPVKLKELTEVLKKTREVERG